MINGLSLGPSVRTVAVLLVVWCSSGTRAEAVFSRDARDLQLGQGAAGTPELLLDQGRRLFDGFQYDQAVPLLDRIISALSSGGPVQKPELLVQALELRARARFALNDAQGAEQDFSALLLIDPAFKLGAGISPRVVAVLDSVRRLTIGQILLSVTPAGEVQIDGRPFTAQAEARSIDLPAGEHQLSATRQGYRPLAEKFTVTAGASVPIAISLERVSATLTLASIPDGVEVLLDGTPRGSTTGGGASGTSAPFTVADLQPGSHRLLLRRPCYRDLERTIAIERPDDLQMEPVRLTPAVATVKIQTAEPGATVLLDGVARGQGAVDLNSVCEGPHVIEVKGPRGRFIDRREWKTGDEVTLVANLRSAFPIVATSAGATSVPLAQVRTNVERALASVKSLLVYTPAESEIESALRGENVPPNWLTADPGGAAAPPSRVPRELVRDIGRRLSTKLGAQGVAAVSVGADPYVISVALLAAGSGEADVFTVNLADPASRTRIVELLGVPLPPLMRPSIETSVVDVVGSQGAVVVRAGGAGAKAGLAMGDTIVGAGGGPIRSVAELRAKVSALRPPALDLPLDVKGPTGATKAVTGAVAMVPDTLPMRDPQLQYNRALTEIEERARVATTPADKSAARLNLAVVHMRLGNWEDAQTELAAVQLPDGPGVSAGTVAYLTGLCFEALGRPTDAQTAFTRAAASLQARLSYEGPLVAPLAQQKLRR